MKTKIKIKMKTFNKFRMLRKNYKYIQIQRNQSNQAKINKFRNRI